MSVNFLGEAAALTAVDDWNIAKVTSLRWLSRSSSVSALAGGLDYAAKWSQCNKRISGRYS